MSQNQTYQIVQLPIGYIKPNPNQPRQVFDEAMLGELAQSISLYGVMQPISVRKVSVDHYEIVAGERRLRASKLLGYDQIPAIVVNVNEKDSAILALIENLQRENLNYMEEARGYEQLILNYELKQQDLAKQLGKGQSTISNKLRLLTLSNEVQLLLLNSDLSERHARALLKLNDKDHQLLAVEQIVKKNLTVAETEKLIQKLIKDSLAESEAHIPKPIIKGYLKDIRLFTNTIKQAVDMVHNAGLDVDYQIKQTDDAYEISIHIPIQD